MIRKLLTALFIFCALGTSAQTRHKGFRENIPLDSIVLSDPAILPDEATRTYYMTGTGGLMWKSKDLRRWSGPYDVAQPDPKSWMGPRPAIWAAEFHKHNGKYYYFATFTNPKVVIDTVRGNRIERRASHVLVSDTPDGPYTPMQDSIYLPADKPTLDGTFWVDTDGKQYMVYCYEWLQNWDGTIEKIQLKPDLSGSVGEGKVLFRASDSPWSREKEDGRIRPNKVTDGPWLFRTGTGRLGMLWTSWIYDVYTQGVAYSVSGTLDGPWIQEKDPVTPPNHGHGMLFRTFDGDWMMSVHSHEVINGKYHRVPTLFHVDLSGDKLILGEKVQTAPQTEKSAPGDSAYLFVFHQDPTSSLYMATSRDGYTFTALNNGRPVMSGDTLATQHGIRDPHICQGPDGAFYLAMTDLNLRGKEMGFRDTRWERDQDKYGWGNNHGFVLMKSYDLINWTKSVAHLDKMFPGLDVGCAWAPETIYDPDEDKMMVYFTMRLGNGKTKLYYSYTNPEFTRLVTKPKELFRYPNPEIQILDADISRMPDGRYCLMYVAQEQPGGIKMAFSDKINRGYKYSDQWADAEPGACEAPNVWKRHGQDKWVLMYDIFSINPHNFGFVETSDFKTFKDLGHFNEGPMKTTNFTSPKHGAIIPITREQADCLEKYWADKAGMVL